ncbi:hypothetical protein BD560DRAFT_26175 [Blakeslea trispora]|nr:hypothetical protein BD560DRAFT_26175 [Blakeslea trispora]
MADNHTPYPQQQQQNANAFLKNLSQKKYAWMEEAIASTPPISATNPTSSTSSSFSPVDTPKRQKKQKTSESPTENIKRIHTIKPKKPLVTIKPNHSDDPSSSQKPSSPRVIAIASKGTQGNDQPRKQEEQEEDEEEEEEGQEEEEETQRRRHTQPRFKYTNFPVKGYSILPTRNITSTYARNDTSYFAGYKAGSKEISPDVS